MCTQVLVMGDPNVDVETCGELWSLVGKDNVVIGKTLPGHEFDANECLCHIDIEATAQRAGYTCRSGWDDACCDYIWEKAPR